MGTGDRPSYLENLPRGDDDDGEGSYITGFFGNDRSRSLRFSGACSPILRFFMALDDSRSDTSDSCSSRTSFLRFKDGAGDPWARSLMGAAGRTKVSASRDDWGTCVVDALWLKDGRRSRGGGGGSEAA